MKLPSIQFYPGDWRKDPAVQSLNYHDRGVWFEILMLMFESPHRGRLMLTETLPMPETALARLLGMDVKKVRATLRTLVEFGVCQQDPGTGVIYSRRMVKDEMTRGIRKEAGKLGGNPQLKKPVPASVNAPAPATAPPMDNPHDDNFPTTEVNQNPTTRDKVKPTPSSSSSISSSTSPSVKKETTFPFVQDRQSLGPEPQVSRVSWSATDGFQGVSGAHRDRWARAYPAVNVDRAMAAASEWLVRNPARKKKHPDRFLAAWLARDQERGGDLRQAAFSPAKADINPNHAAKLPWE